MKRLVISTISLFVITIIVVAVVDVSMLSVKDKYSMSSHERNVLYSYERLQSIKDTNKIVIIAGSNGSYSINSKMISEAFNMPVVNTSAHAGIGLRMQFEIYKDFLRKGDMVILCPVYGGSKKRLYGEVALLRILSTHLPSAYRKISFDQFLFLHKYIGVYFDEALKSSSVDESRPISCKFINSYGDIDYERTHCDTIKPCHIDGIVEKEYIDYLKGVFEYAKTNGIKLVFVPPTLMESEFKAKKERIDSIAWSLKSNGIEYMVSPSKYSFNDTLFFDTPYHMTSVGASISTGVLIEDIRKILFN